MNFAGSAWVTEKRDTTIQTLGDAGFNLERMEHYMHGIREGHIRIKKTSIPTPTHFGYEINETLAQVVNYTTTYMVTTENGRQAAFAFPENVRPNARQWNEKDFTKLKADQTVDYIYDNGELEVWEIYAK